MVCFRYIIVQPRTKVKTRMIMIIIIIIMHKPQQGSVVFLILWNT